MINNSISRRSIIRSSTFGLLSISAPNILSDVLLNETHDRYPALQEDWVRQAVGLAHSNLESLQVLVDNRPELAKACWDWGFGDFETPIDAASHVGRIDIADYLISMGARPTIFTYAMLGHYTLVEEMIRRTPDLASQMGPHGISLTAHVKVGARNNGKAPTEVDEMLAYINNMDDSGGPEYLALSEEVKAKYVGDYIYGKGPHDGFSVRLNMRGNLALGRLGSTGGQLLYVGRNFFHYGGAPSVSVHFRLKDEKVKSLFLIEPDLSLEAMKIN